jgi:hypothetical protein
MKVGRSGGVVLFAFLSLAACGQATLTPVPAKPGSTSTASPAAATPTLGLVLLDISGDGSHQSNQFTAPLNWDIVWEATPEPNTTGSFLAINIYDPSGKPVASTITANLDSGKRSDTVHMHYAGTVYLDVTGVGQWHIKGVTT